MTSVRYAGIDVSKAHLDAATTTRSLGHHPNNPRGWRSMCRRLHAAGTTHVVFEATGGYEKQAADALEAAGFTVCIVKPVCVRRFAEAMDIRAKNDRIDARLIAAFATTRDPRPRRPPCPKQLELRALYDRRGQIVEDRVREEGRLEHVLDAHVAKRIRASIRKLRVEEHALEQRLRAIHATSELLREQAARWQVIPGVGEMTVFALQTHLPELGTVSRQEIAAMVGVAPFERSSGTYQGRRSIRAGRAPVRRALYMAALTAVRHDPALKEFYRRLRAVGKQAKVALVACARKLAVRLNAIEKHWLAQEEAAIQA